MSSPEQRPKTVSKWIRCSTLRTFNTSVQKACVIYPICLPRSTGPTVSPKQATRCLESPNRMCYICCFSSKDIYTDIQEYRADSIAQTGYPVSRIPKVSVSTTTSISPPKIPQAIKRPDGSKLPVLRLSTTSQPCETGQTYNIPMVTYMLILLHMTFLL